VHQISNTTRSLKKENLSTFHSLKSFRLFTNSQRRYQSYLLFTNFIIKKTSLEVFIVQFFIPNKRLFIVVCKYKIVLSIVKARRLKSLRPNFDKIPIEGNHTDPKDIRTQLFNLSDQFINQRLVRLI